MKGALVVSWCHKDTEAVLRSAERLAATGPYPDVLLYLQPDVGVDHDPVHKILQPHFKEILIQPPFDAAPEGWPQGPNHMFKRAAKALMEMPVDYYYFWEPDCLPLKPNWWNDIEIAYIAATVSGKKFMGAVLETKLKDPAGKFVYDGVHMVGAGLYPKEAPLLAPRTVLPTNLAWDVAGQHEIMPLCYETPLIQHNWNTTGYVSLGQIRADAVVHHGCKDSSLYDLLTGKVESTAEAPPILDSTVPKVDLQLEDHTELLDDTNLPSVYEVVLPHAIGLLQALCRDKNSKKRISRALRDASLIDGKK